MKKTNPLFKIICVLGLLTAQLSYADQSLNERECDDRDVSSVLGPLRDQGNIGWCYANAAADLLSFRYSSQLGGEQVSSGYVAITFNQYTKLKADKDAGYVSPAVWLAENEGAVCPQSFQDEALKSSPNHTIKDQIEGLVTLKEAYNNKKKNPDGWAKAISFYQNSKSVINEMRPGELTGILENSTVRNFPRILAERLCQNKMKRIDGSGVLRPTLDFVAGWKNIFPMVTGKVKLQSPMASGREGLIREMNEQLGKNNMVGLSYNTKIFKDLTLIPKGQKPGGPHASSVVGRKWINGQCHFKLRNSWGKRCDLYTNPALKGKCDPSTGYLWLPETVLKETIADIMYYHR